MFAIDLEQKQYKTYILSDQIGQSRLEVVPERGGIITSWQIRGKEMLYLDAERFANPELTVRGGIPILFPICGNLPDNTYTYQGQSYTLKQHGFARDLPWEVTDRVTQDGASLTLVLNSNDQTRAVYPFDFQLIFTYRLQGNSLEIHQRYTNHSAEAMPFSTGLHPYFQVFDKTQLQFEIPSNQFQNQRDKSVQSFSGQFDFDLDEIDASFWQLSGQSAAVADLGQQTRLKLDYAPLYSTLVFWTVKGKDFYCLEPWSAPRNALNTGDRLTHLASGETLETVVQLTADF
ncbi:aldose epimerase [Leptolyngbya sp. FACHB-541]|uniref:aldose epimerase family protein n=1 Tax=Leptolyngbya sp. FACHB-541 TaxID=2692810 RepID=UPI00168912A8|nr:aldose epimerase [Leptolyngbya sp. FACHB-541]